MKNPRFLIITTGFNCEKYVHKNLASIAAQTYRNFCVSVVDDGSTDNTSREIGDWQHKDGNENWTTGAYYQNRGTVFARQQAILNRTDYDAIAMVDMDDELLPNALELAAKEYAKGKWMTYGNYQFADGRPLDIELDYSKEIHRERSYRQDPIWRCTHLRTFRKELYPLIPVSEQLIGNGVKSYPDVHLCFSMMEMCGRDRIGIIKQPIYIYNTNNPLSSLRRFGKDHIGYAEICALPKKELLTSLP